MNQNHMTVRNIAAVIAALLIGLGLAQYGIKLPNKVDEAAAHKLHAEFCERLLRGDKSGALKLISDSVGGKEDLVRFVNKPWNISECKENGLPEVWDSPGPSDGMRQWVMIKSDEKSPPNVRIEWLIVFAYSRSLLSDWKHLTYIEGSSYRIQENDDGTTTILESIPLDQPLSLNEAIHEECLPASRYPRFIRAAVKLPATYSGLWTLGGTSRENCAIPPGCKIYSKNEFEELWRQKVSGFMDEALFAVMPCRLEADYPQLLAEAEARAWAASTLPHGSDAERLIMEKSGKWCGRHLKVSGLAPAEMMISFQQRRKRPVGYATMAWARVPGGSIGEEDYYDQMLLVPRSVDLSKGMLVLHEVSRFRSGNIWMLALNDMVLRDNGGREYRLSRGCEGYWTKAGDFPF